MKFILIKNRKRSFSFCRARQEPLRGQWGARLLSGCLSTIFCSHNPGYSLLGTLSSPSFSPHFSGEGLTPPFPQITNEREAVAEPFLQLLGNRCHLPERAAGRNVSSLQFPGAATQFARGGPLPRKEELSDGERCVKIALDLRIQPPKAVQHVVNFPSFLLSQFLFFIIQKAFCLVS